jgi:type II secretory pathway component PulF
MKVAVRLGEQLGLLETAMRQQLAGWEQIDAALQLVLGRFFYLGTVLCILSGIVTFVMLKIVPVYQKMFEEFGLKLPAITLLVINLSKWFVNIGWLLVMPLLGLCMPTFFLIVVLYYTGWLPRNIPGWWLLFRRYDGALVMRGLALAIRRGVPLPAALRLVADTYPLTIVSGRVRRVAERVEAGQHWCQALAQGGLIGGADVAVLSAAERAGNLPWALEEMADSALRRQTYRVQAVLQFLFPVLLLVLGFTVFLFVAGMFLPLVSLIQGLT